MLRPPELLRTIEERLTDAGIENATREAEWIVEAATGLSRADLVVSDAPIPDDRASVARSLADRRASGEPLQYVTGIAGFRRLELMVGPGVFIPRPETESVAGVLIERAPQGGRVIDVGTGSGAIALAVKDERPDLEVWATEVDPKALTWATRNRDALGLDVHLVASDLFDDLPDDLAGTLDVVVSNPPYVPKAFHLPPEVVEHEPHTALFADEHGLEVIERLADQAREWLKSDGLIVLEIGEVQRDAVARLLKARGYVDVAVQDDLTGRPRIASGRVG